MHEGSNFSISSTLIIYPHPFIFITVIRKGMKYFTVVWFAFPWLMTLSTFSCAYGHLYNSFVNMSSQILCPFLNCVILLLISLCILDTRSSSDTYDFSIFSLILWVCHIFNFQEIFCFVNVHLFMAFCSCFMDADNCHLWMSKFQFCWFSFKTFLLLSSLVLFPPRSKFSFCLFSVLHLKTFSLNIWSYLSKYLPLFKSEMLKKSWVEALYACRDARTSLGASRCYYL